MVRILILLLLLLICIIDIQKLIIPDYLNLLLLLLAFLYRGFNLINIENSLIGMGIYSLIPLFLYGYLRGEPIGFGDIKLMLSLGYILGYTSIFDVFTFYTVAFSLAAIFGILLLLVYRDKKVFKKQLPFSPYLILTFLYFYKGNIF